MKRFFLISLLALSSFSLISCSNEKKEDKKVLTTEKNLSIPPDTISPNSPDTSKSIVLADSFTSSSPFIFNNSILYFPNWDDNNKISLVKSPDKAIKFTKSSVSEFFNYSTNSMTLFQNSIFFANNNDGNKLYRLNLTTKEATLVTNFPVKELCNDGVSLYFTNLTTGNLFSHNAIDNITTPLTSDKVGKFLINGKNIFYQNGSDRYKLYRLSSDGKEKVKLTDFSVDSFVPYNNALYCINSDDHNNLYSLDIKNLSNRRLTTLNGKDLNRLDKKLLFIDQDDHNKLKTIDINLEKNSFKTTTLLNESINDYYLTEKGVFYRKGIDVNSSYYFLPLKK